MTDAHTLVAVGPRLIAGAVFPVTVLMGVTLAATETFGPAPVLTTYAVWLSGENTIAGGPWPTVTGWPALPGTRRIGVTVGTGLAGGGAEGCGRLPPRPSARRRSRRARSPRVPSRG